MKILNKNSNTNSKKLQTFFLGKDRDYFVENLSMLASSGMGILAALDAISDGVHSKQMRRIIVEMRNRIEAGASLWSALEQSGIFHAHTISLIRIGEESGNLAENLKIVGSQEEKDRIFRSKIRSAMLYPLFVFSLTLIIDVGIAWFILPKLALVFSQLRIKLPLITQYLILLGAFLGKHGTAVIPLFAVGLILIIYFIFYFRKTKYIGQSMLFWVPGVKRLIQEIELARFGYLLGTLLQAGLQVTQALDSLGKATVFPHYQKLYNHLKTSIDDGNSFQKSFASYNKTNRLIPMPIQQLIAAGEQSGNLPEILLKISKAFDAKTEITTKNLTVILEPILLVIVWLGVVAVAFAVILPIYGLIGGLKTQ